MSALEAIKIFDLYPKNDFFSQYLIKNTALRTVNFTAGRLTHSHAASRVSCCTLQK